MNVYRTVDVAVEGGDLRVAIWEPETVTADTPSILLIHGLTASHKAWPGIAAALPNYRVIAPDLRGRGRSNELPGPWGLVQHATDMAAVTETLSPGTPIPVVGHSMGAAVALVLSHRFPDLVERLILVDGGLPLDLPADTEPIVLVEALLGPAAERLAMEFTSVSQYTDLWRPHPAFGDNWNEIMESYIEYDLIGAAPHLKPATVLPAVTTDSVELQGSPAFKIAIEKLDRPAVFLRAERGVLNQPGGLFPRPTVEVWAKRLKGLDVVEVADVNHYTIIMGQHGIDEVTKVILNS